MIFIGLIIVCIYLFYKWAVANNDYFKDRGVAFVKPTFLLGSSASMFYNRLALPDLVTKRYNELPNAKISGLFEFRQPIYFVRDAKLLKKLAVKDFDYFADHRTVIDGSTDILFSKSLISLKGQKWRDMRSTLSPMFTGSKMRTMFEHVANVGQQTALTMKDQIKAGADNVLDFKELAMKFTVDVIASTAFGIEINSFKDPENEFHKIATTVTDFSGFRTMLKIVGLILMKPLMKAMKISLFDKKVETFFQEAVYEMMKNREEKGIVRHDIINLLMQAKKGKLTHETKGDEKVTEGFATVEESQVGKSKVTRVWDDDDFAAQCFLFFVAGFDTISTTMSFMAHELAVNQEIQEKLFKEIREINDDLNGKTITYDKIQGMKYMDQVVCETLRKWPPAPMMDRACVKDYELEYDGKKFTFQKGMSFFIPIFGFHRDPKNFPEPLKFDPERFSDENRASIDPDTYLPFGIGPRNCIGSRFALMELKTVFYYMLLNFQFAVTEKTQNPLVFGKSPAGLVTEKGTWVALNPRK